MGGRYVRLKATLPAARTSRTTSQLARTPYCICTQEAGSITLASVATIEATAAECLDEDTIYGEPPVILLRMVHISTVHFREASVGYMQLSYYSQTSGDLALQEVSPNTLAGATHPSL